MKILKYAAGIFTGSLILLALAHAAADRVIEVGGNNALIFKTNATTRFTTNSTGTTFSQDAFLTQVAGSDRYLTLTGDNTNTGRMVVQAGGGSAAFGGSLLLYGHSHASKPGWVTAGISSGSGGKFSVNSQALGAGTDVFQVDATGGVVVGGNTTGDSNLGTISSVTNSAYYTGSFTATFTGATTNFSSTQTVTVSYVRVGKMVTMYVPGKTAACGSGTVAVLTGTGIPSALRPTLGSGPEAPVFVSNNGATVAQPGYLNISPAGSFLIQRDYGSTAFTATTNCGFASFVISYPISI